MLIGHLGCILSAAVVDGGNVCCEPKSLPPVAQSTGARNWAPLVQEGCGMTPAVRLCDVIFQVRWSVVQSV